MESGAVGQAPAVVEGVGMSASIIRRRDRPVRLLGPDGSPIVRKQDTEIPFIRYNAAPGVPRSLHTIDRGAKVYAKALPFLSRGGRFVCQITPFGKAQLVAGFPVDDGAEGELAVVAEEVVHNNAGAIGVAVDRLVDAAVRDMDRVILGEAQAGETLN